VEPLLVILYSLVIGSYFLYRRKPRYWGCDPAFWFVIAQAVIFYGTVVAFRTTTSFIFDRGSHILHLWCMVIGIATFLLGYLLMHMKFKIRRMELQSGAAQHRLIIENRKPFNLLIYAMILASVAISVFYYVAVGYNLFLNTIASMISGQELADSVSLRLAAYSGERYFFPGYVNQFKNVLLPVCAIFVVTRYLLHKNKRDLFLSILVIPVTIVMLLGTGQRGAFLTAVAIAIISMSMSLSKRKKLVVLFITVPIVLMGYIVNSYASGRIGQERVTSSVFSDMIERVTVSNQISGIVGFELVHRRYYSTQNEWTDELLNILPGRTNKKLESNSALVFSLLFGSTRGTAPLSIWGSIYNSFKWPGIVVVPFLLGLFFGFIYYRFLKGRDSLFRRLLWSAVAFNCGTWITGGPMHLFNSGVIALGILGIAYAMVSVSKNRSIVRGGRRSMNGPVTAVRPLELRRQALEPHER
jgi:oligosaccharide repeat unit polymerase